MSAYKLVQRTSTIGAVVADAFSEIENLAGEMRETYDNMEGANMGHLDKCERAGEAADTLEGIATVDVPEALADLPVTYGESVPTRKGRTASRETRLGNAVGMLSAAIEAANDTDDFASELQTAIDEAEGVEFPGMFG